MPACFAFHFLTHFRYIHLEQRVLSQLNSIRPNFAFNVVSKPLERYGCIFTHKFIDFYISPIKVIQKIKITSLFFSKALSVYDGNDYLIGKQKKSFTEMFNALFADIFFTTLLSSYKQTFHQY